MRILLFGLPGSGKTTLAHELVKLLPNTAHLNADAVRKAFDDWDFSPEGRLRQVRRMREMADASGADYAICDFVCPTEEYRRIFNADYAVWMDTIEKGRYEDTNKIFEEPIIYDFRIRKWDDNERVLNWIMESELPSDSNLRSIAKAVSWRALGTLDTFLLSWLITGEWKRAAAIEGTEVITKMILYYLHERAWARVRWV